MKESSVEPHSVTTGHPCILAGAYYVLPGDRGHRFTFVPYEIRNTSPTHGGWDGEECVVPKDELTLKASFMTGLVK